jgi:hypothetical protein
VNYDEGEYEWKATAKRAVLALMAGLVLLVGIFLLNEQHGISRSDRPVAPSAIK